MFRSFHKNDSIRKMEAEMAPRGWIKFVEALWVITDCVEQTFHLVIETHAQFR